MFLASNIENLLGKVHCSDALKFVERLPDDCVDFIMTSPPYWGLRDYGVEGQIGLERHPREYIDRIALIFREVRRILRPHGSLYLNLGDTYCSTKGACFNAGGGKRSLRQPAFKRLDRIKNPNRMVKPNGGWLQAKQLLLIPSRVAARLQEDGWILRNDIIWYKPNGLPNSVKDRLTNKYEHVFHFVKSKRYFYDLDAIRLPHKRGTARAEIDFKRMLSGRQVYSGKWNGSPTQRAFVAGHVLGKNPGDVFRTKTADGSYRGAHTMRRPPNPSQPHAFHSRGKNPGDVLTLTKHEVAIRKFTADSLHRRAYHARGKNPGDFWEITTRPFPQAHFAVYPLDLCVRPIQSSCPQFVCTKCEKPPLPKARKNPSLSISEWRKAAIGRGQPLERLVASWPGGNTGLPNLPHPLSQDWKVCACKSGFEAGIVFDPFAGAGSTLLVAQLLGRRWLGCELKKDYTKMAECRIRSGGNADILQRLTATTPSPLD